MIGQTDDGELREAHFDFYQGLAGIRRVGIEIHVAYHGNAPGPEAIGTTGTVGDSIFRVARARASGRNRGMVLLVVIPA